MQVVHLIISASELLILARPIWIKKHFFLWIWLVVEPYPVALPSEKKKTNVNWDDELPNINGKTKQFQTPTRYIWLIMKTT